MSHEEHSKITNGIYVSFGEFVINSELVVENMKLCIYEMFSKRVLSNTFEGQQYLNLLLADFTSAPVRMKMRVLMVESYIKLSRDKILWLFFIILYEKSKQKNIQNILKCNLS
ncbi:hypothetical protein [Methanohalophilus halophilus]|uniref:Uncharacterized protein n=1 Tax=Methanohalophilus halophilus TaxID=2177 RepID=A0A1L3Q053_9EURY|nr:hypothetical protein [Methanohalophilus halophilus]APH38225.1 hypothetical protein BHR79_01150 [Methanohalophilus halophilus]RNI10908.1 hypothetical protein EFE40_01640 [Methanohalophilus halophilus]SDV99795.1 hypothetical protein SAMN04515625_0052 [Methanohalophilus halophilus]